MKKTIPRLTALTLAAAVLLTACAGGNSAATMHLRKAEGTVAVSDSEGKAVEPQENLGLYSGYGVGTQAESYAWIDLDKVKLAKLDAGSEIEIAKEGKKLEINVKSGSMLFNVTEPLADDETMDITTSTMMLGIRGTCGWVTENTAALLEGTVTVTAGDQTASIGAGEMVILRKEGELDVIEFTYENVPEFVQKEILDDSDLEQAVSDACGIKFPTSYEELLSILAERPDMEVVYSEIIDFEGDGSPEFLVINKGENNHDSISIYRNEPDGLKKLHSMGGNRDSDTVLYSLVEYNGKLFVCRERLRKDDGKSNYCWYYGSAAQEDGSFRDWGTVDHINQGRVAGHDESGFVPWNYEYYDSSSELSDVEAVQGKYTLVRELVYIEGAW